MGLSTYQKKRNFSRTQEPRGSRIRSRRPKFVVQKHAASRLHYDFRLEHGGVLLSWAVPKGPSLDPGEKRLAVLVEDHPVQYGSFEGVIEQGQYGAGSVLLWDGGTWEPEGDVESGLRKGKLDFSLHGKKLRGAWRLIRLRGGDGEEKRNWLLIKRGDDEARAGGGSIIEQRPESVSSGRTIDEIDTKSGRVDRSTSTVRRKRVTSRRPAPESKAVTRRSSTGSSAGAMKLVRDLRDARRAPLPEFVPVQLATLTDSAPTGEGWIHEVKYDGYRMLLRLDRGKLKWLSRNGQDWTSRFGTLSLAIAEIPARSALLDGEVVVLDDKGVSDFHGLQEALSNDDPRNLTYFAFDLLHLDRYDLRNCRLSDRKNVLQALLEGRDGKGPVRFSEHVEDRGDPFFRAACSHSLEGIVSKRAEGRYLSRRSREWLKVKCGHRQEFVIVGFTLPKRSRGGLGAIAVAVREGKSWRYAGRVGTGFDSKSLLQLRARLEGLRRDDAPVVEPIGAAELRGVVWVEPRIVVEVSFAGWTSKGLLRHASFEGFRPDKDARRVVREQAVPASRSRTSKAKVAPGASPRVGRVSADRDPVTVAGITITHPERVIDSQSGVTKLEVARYYEGVAARILPHIEGRPLSVLRCPSGLAGPSFFQKHNDGRFGAGVKSIALRDSKGPARYLTVDTIKGLISLVQMNVIELHPWGSRRGDLARPDRMTFDLDPAPDMKWEQVLEAAFLVRDVLVRMEIRSFAKTTGGKGIHVVVPLRPRSSWAEVKAFSRAVALEIVRSQPGRYVAVASKAARRGRIFIDYLRNGRGATAVAPYSLRAREGVPVALPISWKKLEATRSGNSIQVEHGVAWKLQTRSDPWARFGDIGQVLPVVRSR